MLNVSNDPSEAHKKSFKRKSGRRSPKEPMEKTLDLVNQKVQDALKKFQDTKNKEHEKTQKQMNELRENFNKQQSQTKDTI
jgi:hypothetical protein